MSHTWNAYVLLSVQIVGYVCQVVKLERGGKERTKGVGGWMGASRYCTCFQIQSLGMSNREGMRAPLSHFVIRDLRIPLVHPPTLLPTSIHTLCITPHTPLWPQVEHKPSSQHRPRYFLYNNTQTYTPYLICITPPPLLHPSNKEDEHPTLSCVDPSHLLESVQVEPKTHDLIKVGLVSQKHLQNHPP